MFAGRRPLRIQIQVRSAGTDEYGQPSTAFINWRTVWGSLISKRGGELVNANEVQSQPTVSFAFEYLDVMTSDGAGKYLTADMVFRVLDRPEFAGIVFDIDALHPDYDTMKNVRVDAIGKREPV
jgi:SPP1 family predicted phage head-tail adaptor